MGETKFTVGLVALVAVLLAGMTGMFGYMAGALALNVAENAPPIPPDLEAAYRQVSYDTGVSWALLAAWDGVENRFAIPVPSVDSIYRDLVDEVLEARQRAAEAWCEGHPNDTTHCPPEPSTLLPGEEGSLWRRADAQWRAEIRRYVERRAGALRPYLADLERDPEDVYRRVLDASTAARAAEMMEGYLLLEALEADADEILVAPVPLPGDWVPVAGFAWPVSAPITSRYGMRVSPVDGVRRLHGGIDLGVVTGTPIRASKGGTVVRAEMDDTYGLVVVVEHSDGYGTLYAHHSSLAVSAGSPVQQGQVVGYAGSTGRSTGPHLHFEIHYHGAPVDPLLLLTQGTGRD